MAGHGGRGKPLGMLTPTQFHSGWSRKWCPLCVEPDLVDDAAMTNAMKKKKSSAAAVDAFEGVAADLAGAGAADAWPPLAEAALAFTTS